MHVHIHYDWGHCVPLEPLYQGKYVNVYRFICECPISFVMGGNGNIKAAIISRLTAMNVSCNILVGK